MQFRSLISTLVIIPMIFFSCSQPKEKDQDKEKDDAEKKETYKEVSEVVEPGHNEKHTIGDEVSISFTYPDSLKSDSAVVYAEGDLKVRMDKEEKEAEIKTDDLSVGENQIRIEVYLNNGHKETHHRTLKFKSDIQPENYEARIVKTYPHNKGAYTQGLFYEDGFLYEGTGQRGRSSLRKVKLETGEAINAYGLPNQYFGEGITSYKDKIIQLTWTSRTGFVYDKEKFKLINKVRYPTQGWGLTTDGDKLIMSDGSQNIYFLDPESFSELDRIQVYDHKGSVDNLNELEYIDGKVYANVWQETYIISFDPESGKVLEKIDCSNLVPDKYKNDKDKVLNGIAYDQENGRIFLTGKHWSKLYHVDFVK
ncbi:MAG: glutaminyl-peptide cyclotransferase [Bacteroidota bacterium]